MLTEENEIPPLEECQSEAVTNRKMSNILFQPELKLKASYPNLLKTDRPSSEVMLKSIPINPGGIKRRNLDSSPTEIRWPINSLSLARRKSTSLVSLDSKSKGSFQSQDSKEDLELKYLPSY